MHLKSGPERDFDGPTSDADPEPGTAAWFLDLLAGTTLGQIALVNAASAVRLRHSQPSTFRELVQHCAREAAGEFPLDAERAFAIYRRICERHSDLHFQHIASVGECRTIAIVLTLRQLVEEDYGPIDRAWFNGRKWTGDGLPWNMRKRHCQDELLAALREETEDVLKSDAGLGAPGYVVWFTPVDQDWELVSRGCERGRDGCRVRNRLALPAGRHDLLLEIRSKVELRDLISDHALHVAAPTFVEARGHSRFMHQPEATYADDWGRTFDLELAFVHNANCADGAPELIAEHFPLAMLAKRGQIEWHCLGVVSAAAPGDDDGFLKRLLRGHFWDEVLSSLVGHLKPEH